KPAPLGASGRGTPENPTPIALSMALLMESPDMFATIGVTATCMRCRLTLSAGGPFAVTTWLTTTGSGWLLASPGYDAVTGSVPAGSEEVVNVATPFDSVPTPITLPLRENVTMPVGEFPVTVAVNVTGCPTLLGFGDDVSVIEVTAFV